MSRIKKIIKVLLVCGAGSLFVFFSFFVFAFKSISVRNVLSEYQNIIFLEKDITNCLKDFENTKDGFLSLSEDPWIQFDLGRNVNVEKVFVNISHVKYSDQAQMYYSDSEIIAGDKYSVFAMEEGLVEVILEENIRILRVDPTSKRGNELFIDKIVVVKDKSGFIDYLITCLFVFVVWCTYVICRAYKRRFEVTIQRNSWLYGRWKAMDQVFSLAISDFKSRFSGSYLGMFWGVIQPLATIFLFWFVFQVGFRSQPIDDVPFILWLAAGMIPWNHFYDTWSNGTGAFTSYSYIVKKVVFNTGYLPVVKVISSSILGLIFNFILIIIYVLYAKCPGVHIIDLLYFNVCIMIYSLGLSYLTASLNVFIKDVGQFLGILLQFLMFQ